MNAFPEIPGYRIERRIGDGGMASVYLATQLSLDRPVAIKVVHFRGSAREQLTLRFEHEARTIASLEHPNIVGIHEIGRTTEGLPYYSMAYLPNGDLAHACLAGQFERIASVLRMIAQALGYAHAHGVVHRDVKPENVLFDREQRARLADFGISRSLGSVRVTSQGDALGSSAYMSPEQARGHEVDARSDLYSLGVMAFELLAGTLPFHGDDVVAMAMAHHVQPIPRMPAAVARWQPLIDRALAKRVEDRVQDADEFIAMLDRIAQPPDMHRTEALPAFKPPAVITPVRGQGGRVVTLATLLLLAGVVAWRSSPPPVADAVVTPVPGTTTTSDETLAAIADRIAARHWFEPAAGSASELLATALANQRNDERLDAADNFVNVVASAITDALRTMRDAQARKWIELLREFAAAQGLRDRSAYVAFEQALGSALERRLSVAEQKLDPSLARELAELFEQDASLSTRWQRMASARQAGSMLRDKGGPPLRLLQNGQTWFAMGEHEVTRDEYERFAGATRRVAAKCRAEGGISFLRRARSWREPGFEQTGRHPVVCVSHDDARAYAAWLSQQTGKRYRLPSADEWRVAAAGIGAAGSAVCKSGNIRANDSRGGKRRTRHECSDGADATAPVGAYIASRDGLFDLVGNVAEWVGACAAGGPCEERKVMGSSHRDGSDVKLLEQHMLKAGELAALDVGFRVVRELD